MSETKELLKELDGKVSNLLINIKEQKEASIEKSKEIESLKDELKKKEEAYFAVLSENEELKKESPAKDQDELKFKIGEMVKEIDRCISLLKV